MSRKDRLSTQLPAFNKARYFHLFILIALNQLLYGQFADSFPPAEGLHGQWLGDRSHFKVTPDGMLQLSAPGPGQSALFRKVVMPEAGADIRLFFKMDFAPSGDNHLKYFLWTTSADESVATGYYLAVGENGNQDAIHLWQMDKGQHRRLASCMPAAVALQPAQARISVQLHGDNVSFLEANYAGESWPADELLFNTSFTPPADTLLTGFKCTYTQSRKTLFYFDELAFLSYLPDKQPLIVNKVMVEDSLRLRIFFSEPPSDEQVRQPSVYTINQGIGQPDSVVYPLQEPGQALLVLQSTLNSESIYTLTVEGLSDRTGNSLRHSRSFIHAAKPAAGELFLSEILFYPETGGSDFVELYNASNKYVSLQGLILTNKREEKSVILEKEYILSPVSYLAVSQDTTYLKQMYDVPIHANFLLSSLPPLNSAGGIISLALPGNNHLLVLDTCTYSSSMHSPALYRTQGVSLERVHFQASAPATWHSAAAGAGFATPGYKNSAYLENVDIGQQPQFFQVFPAVFTPDSDGENDFCSLAMHLAKPGFLATVHIADQEGYPVNTLLNNALLGPENLFHWDGTDAAGSRVARGTYLMLCRVFHPDGDVFSSIRPITVFYPR